MSKIIEVPWRKNDHDPKMDGDCLKGEVVVSDKNNSENMARGEHARGSGTCRVHGKVPRMRIDAHTENSRKRIETELRGTVESDAAEKRTRQILTQRR